MAGAWFICVFLVFYTSPIRALEEGESCVTPNTEQATCLRVTQCRVITDAISRRTQAAIHFAQQSQCGHSSEPLVCCGTSGHAELFRHRLLPTRCGVEETDIKIYGGKATVFGEFPWMALLKYLEEGAERYYCGGTLITQRYVLTAAHCTKLPTNLDRRLIGVRLGEHSKATNPDCKTKPDPVCADPVLDLGIEEVINYPSYVRKFRVHDISLIRMDRAAPYTKYIRPICLPIPDSEQPLLTNVTLAGWGETEYSSQSDAKLKVSVPITSSTECGVKLSHEISENQFCAGGQRDRDSCNGDSGGPAMRIVGIANPQLWLQEGIVSYGVGINCGLPGYSAVYTKVSKYVNWIVSNIRE